MQMPDEGSILVTGATGNTGRAVAQALVARGVAPLVMARKATDADRMPDGVGELRVADFDEADGLARALDGVARAYLVTPSTERAQEQQIGFVERAASVGVRHIVLLSQLAAAPDSPVRFLRYHAAVEQRIREQGVGFTFLRPNLFQQALMLFAEPIKTGHAFAAPIGDAPVSVVDVRDIGDVAAIALTEPGHDGQVYTLTGPEALTHAQIATEIGRATGAEVTFADSDPQDFMDQLAGLMPPWQAEGLVEDYQHYRRGEAAQVSDDIPRLLGRPARSLSALVQENAAAFR